MTTRWYAEKKHEHFYREAKKNGYRARSAYKLNQIQKKFNIIKKNDTILDLGAAPGGWGQIIQKIVGENGTIIGIDLLYVKPIPGIIFLQGDMTSADMRIEISDLLDEKKVDVVLSDMSPDISGNYGMDHLKSLYLCEKALETAEYFLKSGGCFICKLFAGEETSNFIKKVKPKFKYVKQFSPPASRKSSSEIYVVARGFI